MLESLRTIHHASWGVKDGKVYVNKYMLTSLNLYIYLLYTYTRHFGSVTVNNILWQIVSQSPKSLTHRSMKCRILIHYCFIQYSPGQSMSFYIDPLYDWNSQHYLGVFMGSRELKDFHDTTWFGGYGPKGLSGASPFRASMIKDLPMFYHVSYIFIYI